MPTKIIKTNATLHLPGPGHEAFKIDPSGAIMSGKYSVEKIAPGTEVELDADEADAILKRHGGEEVKAKPTNAPAAQLPAGGSGGGKGK